MTVWTGYVLRGGKFGLMLFQFVLVLFWAFVTFLFGSINVIFSITLFNCRPFFPVLLSHLCPFLHCYNSKSIVTLDGGRQTEAKPVVNAVQTESRVEHHCSWPTQILPNYLWTYKPLFNKLYLVYVLLSSKFGDFFTFWGPCECSGVEHWTKWWKWPMSKGPSGLDRIAAVCF